MSRWFRDAGLDTPDLDARLLVCAACGCDHLDLIRDPDKPLGLADATRLAKFAARRLDHEPVSRIIGTREFWGLSLALDKSVLDPRPETEGLVAAALDAVGGRSARSLRILDLGTGSGAILCALLVELPGAFGIGVDLSEGACCMARHNAEQLGLADRLSIVRGSWAQPVRAWFDLVVSNPPYIERDELAGLAPEVRLHDPRTALDGGADGLMAYRSICNQLPSLLAPGGTVAFECGSTQGAVVAALLEASGIVDLRQLKDLAGSDRVVIGAASATERD